jgi:mevalonate pyrophosphate decarboxylase
MKRLLGNIYPTDALLLNAPTTARKAVLYCNDNLTEIMQIVTQRIKDGEIIGTSTHAGKDIIILSRTAKQIDYMLTITIVPDEESENTETEIKELFYSFVFDTKNK